VLDYWYSTEKTLDDFTPEVRSIKAAENPDGVTQQAISIAEGVERFERNVQRVTASKSGSSAKIRIATMWQAWISERARALWTGYTPEILYTNDEMTDRLMKEWCDGRKKRLMEDPKDQVDDIFDIAPRKRSVVHAYIKTVHAELVKEGKGRAPTKG
jgi:hypothetical protein